MAVIKIRKSKKRFNISTSPTEIKHILISWVAIAFIFSILKTGGIGNMFKLVTSGNVGTLIVALLVAAFTVGIGFVFHESAHKFVAQKYGCFAEFRADFTMLGLAVLMASIFNFVFIAPGAVWIHGNVTRESNGKISAAGPITNFVIAGFFLLLGVMFQGNFVAYLAATGAFVNAWLGLFNMIPFFIFDGAKIWKWNIPIYLTMVAAGVGLILLQSYVL